MTIAAAYTLHGCPVLFADMMLTAPKRSGRVGRLNPTQPYARSVLGGLGLIAAGTIRKAIIVNPRFAVAWSGNFESARKVISRLRLIFKDHTVEIIEDIKDELSFMDDISSIDQCKLVGWMAGREMYCFRWDSNLPNNIELGEGFLEGSGDKLYASIINEPRTYGQTGISSRFELAENALLCHIGIFLSRDWKDSSTTINRFGYWYEGIFLDESNEFKYVDNIVFSRWIVKYNLHKQVISSNKPNIIIRYKSGDRFSVVQTSWLSNDSREVTDTYVDIVGDGGDFIENFEPKNHIIKDQPKKICWSFDCSIGEYIHADMSLVTENGGSLGKVYALNGFVMEFNPEELLETILSSMPRSPNFFEN